MNQHETANTTEHTSWRTLDYFSGYRLISTSIFLLAINLNWVSAEEPSLLINICLSYLVTGVTLALINRNKKQLEVQAFISGAVDIVFLFFIFKGFGGLHTGAGIIFAVPLAVSGMLLRGQLSLALAAIAGFALVGDQLHIQQTHISPHVDFFQAGLHGLAFIGITIFVHILSSRAKDNLELAEQRGIDLANLGQLNELIFQRMRTGIIVVDPDSNIRQMNEAAWYLMGMPPAHQKKLSQLSSELNTTLDDWKKNRQQGNKSLQLSDGVPAIVPRFAGLGQDDQLDAIIVFLEDTSMVSRRAEEMTLSSLGQLAASIAHEIRNPLGAIGHAQQLLAENVELHKSDKRLIEIIGTHCTRMNDIVENVLQLSRRERSRPETIDLRSWLTEFLKEFAANNDLQGGKIRAFSPKNLLALMDPSQLHQIVWNLCSNALKYGHHEDMSVNITLRAGKTAQSRGAILDVMDEGPGIPASSIQSVFQPFYTSSANSSGLGLYITRQICEANQAKLEYIQPPTGGACFRINFAAPRRAFSGTSKQGQKAMDQLSKKNDSDKKAQSSS